MAGLHLGSYIVFWSATLHLVTAGTDATNPISRVVGALVMAGVVFLTLVRVLSGRGRGRQPGRGAASPAAV